MERMIPKGLEPEAVYEIFEEISRIPRASRHEEIGRASCRERV